MSDEMQELAVEMRMKVTAPKMVATKLAEGIKRIIIDKWPECKVTIDELNMISVASADLNFQRGPKAEADEDETK